MDFINYSHPSQTRSTQLKRQAHSSAARATHARARKARITEHQSTTATVPTAKHNIQSSAYPLETKSVRLSQSSPYTGAPHYVGPLSLLGAGRRDPFASATSLFSSHDDFLLDQYITSVIPYLRSHCGAFLSEKDVHVKSYWVQLALADATFLAGLFLLTTRYLNLVFQREEYFQPAIQYKLTCLGAVSKALSEQTPPDDTTLSIALILATDEIMNHDLVMAAQHVNGALRMVGLRGGPQTLGTSSFVAVMLDKYKHVFKMDTLVSDIAPPCGTRFMHPETAVK